MFVWSDAIGLGFFSAVGTSHGVNLGVPYLPAVLCGVATGVFGGLCRDTFLNIKPSLIYDHQPYGSVAFAGCWLYIAMIELGFDNTLSIWVGSLSACGAITARGASPITTSSSMRIRLQRLTATAANNSFGVVFSEAAQ